MGSLERRLEALEAQSPDPAKLTDFGDAWPLDDQLAEVADRLDFFIHFHSKDSIRYQATDRELHLLALLCAANELGPEGGEYTFPSGLTVGLIPKGDGFLIDTPRQIRASDLPEWTREHFERIDDKDQAKRDQRLFAMRGGFEPWREQVRRVEEEQQRRSRESKQRDRELLERNHASLGLPPLTPEEVEKYKLQGTVAP